MPEPSHYELLDVARGASADELRQAFRRLSKRYHPDTTTMQQPQAAAAFQQLQRAYGVLSDPEQRRRYDAELLLQLARPVPQPSSVAEPQQSAMPASVRRPLSGGEWLALVLLVLAAGFSLVLGVGMAWLRGADLVQWPSWWLEAR
jgi:curved DNA-binding protein CbpA